jgi:hypothetical protein
MKTNQWLAYLLDEHRADFVGVLRGAAAAHGWLVPDAAVEAWATSLRDDLEAETQNRTLDGLQALAGLAGQPHAALLPFWTQAETLLNGYIAADPEMVAGAKRLAYLRLSTFSNEIQSYLRNA